MCNKKLVALTFDDGPTIGITDQVLDVLQENEVVASMSANVFKVQVAVGDKVIAGQSLIVLEAMKMEIPIESPRDGEVAEILTQKGATVSTGDVLVKLK